MDKIHHIVIREKGLKESMSWYLKEFDCKVSYEDKIWEIIGFTNTSSALVMFDQYPFHFAIESDNADKYGKLTSYMDGMASIYIQDLRQ